MIGISNSSLYRAVVLLAGLAACSTGDSSELTATGGAAGGGGPTGGGPTGGNGGGGDIITGGTIGKPCTTNEMCGSGRVCAHGVCIFDDGDCANNKDCQGDTYCCLGRWWRSTDDRRSRWRRFPGGGGGSPHLPGGHRHRLRTTLNNYRANTQGSAKGQVYPDITGRIAGGTVCQYNGSKVTLNATVCNRGRRAVGAALPATFYLGDPANHQRLCTAYTKGPVPIGSCLDVSCEIDTPIQTAISITMVVNDNGDGGRVTVECNYDNNRHGVDVGKCDIPK
jgi:hypothetical protein